VVFCGYYVAPTSLSLVVCRISRHWVRIQALQAAAAITATTGANSEIWFVKTCQLCKLLLLLEDSSFIDLDFRLSMELVYFWKASLAR